MNALIHSVRALSSKIKLPKNNSILMRMQEVERIDLGEGLSERER